jgi:DNA polymerase I-like protein with 3'-5' exonuclease and polymerase domains
MEISLDTETNGSDFWHGCKPFYVSTFSDTGKGRSWQWEVDPFDRSIVYIEPSEIESIRQYLNEAEKIWLHNSKYDIRALSTIGIEWTDELWAKTNDTLVMSHIVDSLMKHGLKALCTMYLYIDDEDESDLKDAATKARRMATSWNQKAEKLGHRLIDKAREQHPTMPGTKEPKRKNKDDEGGWWCLDMWLPRSLKVFLDFGPDEWLTICGKYADTDAVRTMRLAQHFMEYEVNDEILRLYADRMKEVKATYNMESTGIHLIPRRLELKKRSTEAAKRSIRKRLDAYGVNPASPKQLSKLLFTDFGLPILEVTKPKRKKDGTYSKGGNPSTSQDILHSLELIATGKAKEYLTDLLAWKKQQSASVYQNAYSTNLGLDGRLRSQYNITGTQTTRYSASLVQNIGKREDMNQRDLFGPPKNAFWISADFVNIELITAATCADEQEMLDVFRQGKSYHLLIASAIYPEELEEHGESGFKKLNLYRRVKSGNYAIQYGAQEAAADWTYGRPGAYNALRSRFTKLFTFSDSKLEEAKRTGRVKTLGGYPLVCPKSKGRTEPTKPFSYWCQGSVGEIISRAMVSIDRETDVPMVMTVHDELVFEIPFDYCRPEDWEDVGYLVKGYMEQAALSFGIQVPVTVSLHLTSWNKDDAEIKGEFY